MFKKTLSTRAYLVIFIGSFFVIFFGFIQWGLSAFNKTEVALFAEQQELMQGLVYVLEMNSGVADIKARTFSFILSGESTLDGRPISQVIEEKIQILEDYSRKYSDYEIASDKPGETEKANTIKSDVERFATVVRNAIERKKNGADMYELLVELDEKYVEVYFPLVYFLNEHKMEHLGYLEAFSGETEKAAAKMNIIMYCAILLMLALPIMMYFIIKHYIIKPIEKFHFALDKVRTGDFSERISLDRRDEIGWLAEAFNEMTAQLAKNQQDTENQIQKRTSELEKLNKFMIGRELKMVELKMAIANKGNNKQKNETSK